MKLPTYFELEIPTTYKAKDTLVAIASKVTLTSGKERRRGVRYTVTHVEVLKPYYGDKYVLKIRCERPESKS